MGNESELVVETEGHCFLCSNRISAEQSMSSLKYLSRYLKMDMSKVFNENDSIPQFLLEKVQKSVLKASLCLDCANFTEHFSLLYQQLEKIKLEMASLVSIIHGKLKAIKVVPGDYRNPNEEGIVGKRKIVKNLRMEAFKNCVRKLKKIKPRVKLHNLSRKQVDAKTSRARAKSNPDENQINFNPNVNSCPEDMPDLKTEVAEVKSELAISDSTTNYISDDNYMDPVWNNDELKLNDYDEGEGSAVQSASDGSAIAATSTENDELLRRRVKAQGTTTMSPFELMRNVGTRKYRINPKTSKFECCVCSKEFAALHGVLDHFKAVHLNVKYKCKLCDKEFKYKQSFNAHLKTAHPDVTFKCQTCSLSFTQKCHLERHVRLHNCGKEKSSKTIS